MISRHPLLQLLLLLLLSGTLGAQFYDEPFNADLNNWVSGQGFVFDNNGAAETFPGWDNRSRIRSASAGGSMTFTGPGSIARATSPVIDVPPSTTGELYLSFYQYFGTEGGATRVLVGGDNGTSVDTILRLGLEAGEETSAGSYHLLSLGEALQGATTLTILFELTGGPANFWIIDDVQLFNSLPQAVTFPRYFGEALRQYGKPFVVDARGAPAVPFELVVDWLPGLTEPQKQSFRDMYNPIVRHTCACDRLEVWEMAGGVFFDPVTGAPLGDPSSILSATLPASGMNKVDGLDLNYFNYNDLQNIPDLPNLPLSNDDIAGFSPAPADAVRIAILDTGLDLDHPDLNGYVLRDPESLDGVDEDMDCLVDNPLGWNYVDNNNNPDDDNGHGTHVTGIVARNAASCDGCVIQLIPYKTHDSYGVGTLFSSACAVLQAAVYDDADVLNCSWGFYGGGNTGILKSAIDTAANYGALIVAAAGNDSLNMVADPQYPALYSLNNILAVGAHDTLPAGIRPFAPFSNFDPVKVDLAAFGVNVLSSMPGGLMGEKSGTSMAAPAVAAAAGMYHCEFPWQIATAKAFLLANSFKDGSLTGFVIEGNALNDGIFCRRDVQVNVDDPAADFSLSFVDGIIEAKALQGLGETEFTIYTVSGGIIESRVVESFPQGTSQRFDLQSAPNGQYLFLVQTGGRVSTQRLVKR